MKTKIVSGLAAVSLLVAPAPSSHAGNDAAAWAIGGLVVGAIAGAVIASSASPTVIYTSSPPPPPPAPVVIAPAPPPPLVVVAPPPPARFRGHNPRFFMRPAHPVAHRPPIIVHPPHRH